MGQRFKQGDHQILQNIDKQSDNLAFGTMFLGALPYSSQQTRKKNHKTCRIYVYILQKVILLLTTYDNSNSIMLQNQRFNIFEFFGKPQIAETTYFFHNIVVIMHFVFLFFSGICTFNHLFYLPS